MDRVTKVRKLTRTNVTKTCNKVDQECNKESPDDEVIMAMRDDLQRLCENLQTQDKNVIEEMFQKRG